MDIEDLINNVAAQDFSKAGVTFNELMQSRMHDAIEQEKIAVAGQIFNGVDPDEEQLDLPLEDSDEDDEEDDFTDEEIDDAVAEAEMDEEEEALSHY